MSGTPDEKEASNTTSCAQKQRGEALGTGTGMVVCAGLSYRGRCEEEQTQAKPWLMAHGAGLVKVSPHQIQGAVLEPETPGTDVCSLEALRVGAGRCTAVEWWNELPWSGVMSCCGVG